MSYYMGDYYPRGDPGIGSFLGGLARKAVGFIPGIGPAVSAGLDIFKGAVKRTPGIAGGTLGGPAAGGITAAAGSAMRTVKSAIVKHPVLSAAGAAGAVGVMGGAVAERMMGGRGKCHRINPRTGKCIRRMNSCNPRALRRAVRRLHSFARHYRKTVGFVTPHPKKGRMYFKRRKK